MNIFGLGMAVLGAVAALAADVVSANMGGKQPKKRSSNSQKDTQEGNSDTDS